MEVVSETAKNIVEVKELLEKLKQHQGELNFRAQKTLDYVQSVASINVKQAGELKSDLENLKISRLKEANVQTLVSLTPKTVEDVKAVAQSFSVNLSQDAMKKIVDAVKQHVK
ncbi:hypothetical protein HYV79_04330 [Candidatus Woesearchaeota archaeon]|nr:hypothetical protein [Candidatus Woesearchaeota archaeon]